MTDDPNLSDLIASLQSALYLAQRIDRAKLPETRRRVLDWIAADVRASATAADRARRMAARSHLVAV